jgi:hypothetical protein
MASGDLIPGISSPPGNYWRSFLPFSKKPGVAGEEDKWLHEVGEQSSSQQVYPQVDCLSAISAAAQQGSLMERIINPTVGLQGQWHSHIFLHC